MDSGRMGTIDTAVDDLLAAYDHLLQLVTEHDLDGIDDPHLTALLPRLDGLRNRLLFLEGQLLAEAQRRSLRAA